MTEGSLGAQLLRLLEKDASRVVLVAPFIKTGALARVLNTVASSGAKVDVVTRWHPVDIADGVCDLEILEQVEKLEGGTLWIRHNLHAKYFRVDDTCLIGSANLTGRALGWRMPSNLELMLEVPASFVGLADWEQSLFASSVPATSEMRNSIAIEAEKIRQAGAPRVAADVEAEGDTYDNWMPLCARPDLLYDVYRGLKTAAHMVTSTFEYARQDLRALSVPPELPEPIFRQYVAHSLRQLPVIRDVMEASLRGVPDRNAPEIIGAYHDADHDIPIEAAWSTVKLWMMHFFPDEFRIEADQEVLVRGRQY